MPNKGTWNVNGHNQKNDMRIIAMNRPVEGPLLGDAEGLGVELDDGSRGFLAGPQQYLAFASVCTGSALSMLKASKTRTNTSSNRADLLPTTEEFRARFGYDPDPTNEIFAPEPATTLPFPRVPEHPMQPELAMAG